TYDDENRLSMVTASNLSCNLPQYQTSFTYDGLGRLRRRLELNYLVSCGGGSTASARGASPSSGGGGGGGSSNWGTNSVTEYVYDGKRVIQERDINNTPSISYTRGSDLSGTLEGAGGIGGLLARSAGYSSGNFSSHAYYHADGNGNNTYPATS